MSNKETFAALCLTALFICAVLAFVWWLERRFEDDCRARGGTVWRTMRGDVACQGAEL